MPAQLTITPDSPSALTPVRSKNEVVRFTLTDNGEDLSGQFKFTFFGQTTAGINFNAGGAAIQSALEDLSNVAPGDIVVTDLGLGGSEEVDISMEFAGQYAGVDITPFDIVFVTFTLTGSLFGSTLSNLQAGGAQKATTVVRSTLPQL